MQARGEDTARTRVAEAERARVRLDTSRGNVVEIVCCGFIEAEDAEYLSELGAVLERTRGRTSLMFSALEPDRGQYDAPADRDALFGCAMLVRGAAWEQVGPLWEPFFNYAEETDWCLRARAGG